MNDLLLATYLVLWLLTLAVAVVVLGVARQVGLLTKRFPFDDVMNEAGPQLGSRIVGADAARTTGEKVRLEPRFPARTTMVFVEDECGICERILPAVSEIVAETNDTDFWIIYETFPDTLPEPLAGIMDRVVASPDAFRDWRIATVPYVCVVSTGGTIEAKGQLLHTGRLREELGLPVPDADPHAELSQNVREEETHAHEHA